LFPFAELNRRMRKSSSPRLWIGGEWIAAARTLPVIDPYTGEIFARAPFGGEPEVLRAIAAADHAFSTVREVASATRATALAAIARGIEERRDDFVDTIIAEAGKPLIFAETEVARATITFRAASEESRRNHGELLDLDAFPTGAGHFGLARRFPIGVIAAITPFNFPLNLIAHKVAPCIATNNTMVVKPASKTPMTALLLAEVLAGAGLPAGQVNVVTCDNAAAAPLIHDERVKKVTFTGSPAVGWQLKQQCGKKRITLELGGNAGVIVHADAELENAVPAIAMGGFGQAGQSCISVQRIFVQEKIYVEFRERLLRHMTEKIVTGDPRDRATVVGPMISAEALALTRSRLDAALAAGAIIARGGQVFGRSCLEATVVENASPSLELCAQEVFAPIVTLHRYATFDEALSGVNDSRFGLQAGVFTRDLGLAMRAFECLDVGAVLINQVPTWRVENMPYGGIKESGFGREGIRYAMEEMTELKSMIIRL
jgi:acyl-CoA reductase-like NAD-dependent aldehyde dehydrogenase